MGGACKTCELPRSGDQKIQNYIYHIYIGLLQQISQLSIKCCFFSSLVNQKYIQLYSVPRENAYHWHIQMSALHRREAKFPPPRGDCWWDSRDRQKNCVRQ